MKYAISGMVTVSCWTEVEAESESEALAIAKERGLAGLCRYPYTADVDEAFHFENDGEPCNLSIEC